MPQLEVDCIRVTHPFAGRQHPEGPVTPRLACIKPAASVHPEPVSNSPLLKNVSIKLTSVIINFYLNLLLVVSPILQRTYMYTPTFGATFFSKWDTKVMQPLLHCQIFGQKKLKIFKNPRSSYVSA